MGSPKKVSRRTFLKSAGMVAASAYLVACAPVAEPSTSSGDDGAASESQVTLTLTHWGGESEATYMQSLADNFMEANPSISMDVVQFPANYDEKLLTMIAGGTPPDVQMTLRFTYFNFVAKGVVINLQPYLDATDFDPDQYYEVGLRPYTFRENLYGLPREIDEWVIFYNKNLFDEAGVPYPSGDWTWDDLTTNAQALTKRDDEGRATQFGYGFAHLGGAKAFDGFVYQAGGRLVDNEDDPTKFMMAEPEAVAGVQFMADLANEYGIMPSPRERNDLGSVNDLFVSGKIAMRYGEFWSNLQFQQIEDFEWDIAAPAQGAQQATWVGGACYTVSSQTDFTDEAVQYAIYASGPEGSTVVAENLAGVPSVKAVAESPTFLENTPPDNLQVTLDVFDYGVQPPMLPTFSEWNRLIQSALDPVWTGEQTAEAALTAIAEEAQGFIDQGQEMLKDI
ncbi:MAG: ABC transporter substrate-binding protein [Chloroflexota bacterium]